MSSSRTLRIACWCLRVLALAIIASPVCVRGQDQFPALPDHVPGGAFVGPSTPGAVAPPVACYWTVSSRGLSQDTRSSSSSELSYFANLCDGSLHATSREQMISQFTPGVPVCIFIHGSFVDAFSHRVESAHTYNWIRRAAPHLPAHFIFYTWPSEALCNTVASANPVAVNQRGRWAESNAFYLADVIAHLPHESPVCLVGHSHGARVTVATLHLIGGGQIDGHQYPYDTGCYRRYRAVLAAGAFDRHWLNPGQRYDFAVHRVEGILNMVNRTDVALHFYPLRRPLSRKAITVTGLTRWDRHRLGPMATRVLDYDVTERIGVGHFWPNYYEEPTIGLAISPYVYFTDSQLNPTCALACGRD